MMDGIVIKRFCQNVDPVSRESARSTSIVCEVGHILDVYKDTYTSADFMYDRPDYLTGINLDVNWI